MKMCDKWDKFTNSHKSSWLEQKEFIIDKHPKKMGSNALAHERLNWTKQSTSMFVSLPSAIGTHVYEWDCLKERYIFIW